MSAVLEYARKQGEEWAARTLAAENDRTFVKTGKASTLIAGIMTKGIRASGGIGRLAIEQAFLAGAEERWKQHEKK